MTPEERAVEMAREGKTYSAICAETGLTDRAARRVVHGAGIFRGCKAPRGSARGPRGASEMTQERIRRAHELRKAGKSILTIATILGVRKDAVHDYLATTPNAPPAARVRSCMCCRKDFYSTHSGNRICSNCTRRDSDYIPAGHVSYMIQAVKV